jgi:hypothetical protein
VPWFWIPGASRTSIYHTSLWRGALLAVWTWNNLNKTQIPHGQFIRVVFGGEGGIWIGFWWRGGHLNRFLVERGASEQVFGGKGGIWTIFGGERGIWTGFYFPSHSGFLCQRDSGSATYLCPPCSFDCYHKNEWAKLVNLQIKQCFSSYREHRKENYCHFDSGLSKFIKIASYIAKFTQMLNFLLQVHN